MRHRLVPAGLLVLGTALTACNPNMGLGPAAPEKPPDWAAPPTASGGGHGPNDGHDHGDEADPHGGVAGAPSMGAIVEALKARIEKDPKDYEARLQYGQILAEQGKWDEAAAELDAAAKLEPKKVEPRVVRASVFLQQRDRERAKVELDAAAKISPDHEDVLRGYGSYWLLAEDVPKAIEVRKRLLEKYPDIQDAENIELWNFYLARVSKMRESDPEKVKEFFDLLAGAAAQQGNGDHGGAVETYRKAAAIVPDDPHLLGSMASSLRATGKKDESEATWKKALAIDPSHAKSRLGLARALSEDGKLKDAVALLRAWKKADARRAKRYDADAIIARLDAGESFDGADAASAGAIRGRVSIAPSLVAKLPKDATLFVFGKMQPGGGPPLAVVRMPVSKFPVEFSLSKENVMQPGMPFEEPLYLTARIDVDGVAGASPGDLEGTVPMAFPVGTSGVELVIDTEVGAGKAPTAVAPGGMPTRLPNAGDAGATIKGIVKLDPKLEGKIPSGATLYVFGKMQQGGGPPLAVLRMPVGQFPVAFELTKNDVMQPGMPFDGPLYLTARIDKDGIAGAGPGDLEGVTKDAVPLGATVDVTIDTMR